MKFSVSQLSVRDPKSAQLSVCQSIHDPESARGFNAGGKEEK